MIIYILHVIAFGKGSKHTYNCLNFYTCIHVCVSVRHTIMFYNIIIKFNVSAQYYTTFRARYREHTSGRLTPLATNILAFI